MYTRVFFALMLSNASLRIATMMLVTLVPLYAFDLGLSPVQVGLTSTLYFATAALTRPLSGWLVDSRGRWVIMLLGVALFTAATGLYLLSLPVWLFLALRAVQGAGFSLNGTAVSTLATDIIPEKKLAEGLGILSLEQTVVTIFAPWLALTLRIHAGYEVAFAVALGCCVLNFLVRMALAKEAKAIDARRRAKASTIPGRNRSGFHLKNLVEKDSWRPATVMLCFMFGSTSVSTFLAAYALSQGMENIGLFFVMSGLMLAVSRLLIGTMRKVLSLTGIVVGGVVLNVGAMLCIYFADGLGLLLVAGALFGFSTGVVSPSMNSISVLSARPEARGRASATYFFALDVSTALGAWILGTIAALWTLREAFLTSAAIVALSLLLIMWLYRTGRMPRKNSA